MNDYQAKFVTPEQAVKAVQSGDWVDYGFGAGFPELLDKALAARKGEVKDVKVRGGLVIRPRIEVVEADPEQESFSYYSWHIGDYERKLQKNGLVKFMPVMLRSLPYLYRDKHIRCDVAFVPVSKPDENGYCGLGISNYAWRTIFESARTVIFEINEHYPKLQGVDGSHRVHLSEADYIVEGEHEPLPVRSYRAPSETDIAIAKIVVNEIPDGAVLSLGVGGVPYTVAKMLAESDKKDLGCHTGTISDAFLELYKAGKLTNARKELDTGLSAWNLAMGSQELYDWLDAEPQLFHPGDLDYIHSVERISKLSSVISINGGVQLDLMGQEKCREHRHAPALRHRRPDGLPRGCLPLEGRQGLYLHQLFPRDEGRRAQEQHSRNDPRRQHDLRAAHDDPVCRDRVRHREPFRQDASRARRGHGLHRAPRLPRGADEVRAGEFQVI